MILRRLPEQPFKHIHTSSYNSKCLLKCMSQIIEFVNHTPHRESIREEEKLSRTFDVSVFDYIEFSDSFNLEI